MIVRITLRERIHGPSFSFDSAVVLGQERTFPAQQICLALNQKPYGVEVVISDTNAFTVPWGSIKYTNDIPAEKAGGKAAK